MKSMESRTTLLSLQDKETHSHLPPISPKSSPKPPPLDLPPNTNPYPTTFVQADSSSFKQVVQMLTGSAETAAAAANSPPAAAPTHPTLKNQQQKSTGPKKPAFKLYERRNSLKNLNIISPLIPAAAAFHQHHHHLHLHPSAFSPRNQPEILSPSTLDFPSLVLRPVTPLIPDPFNRSPPNASSMSPAAMAAAAERSIAEKGFYLHPSPRSGGKEAVPPRLLPLFPVTSPRMSSCSSSSSQSSP